MEDQTHPKSIEAVSINQSPGETSGPPEGKAKTRFWAITISLVLLLTATGIWKFIRPFYPNPRTDDSGFDEVWRSPRTPSPTPESLFSPPSFPTTTPIQSPLSANWKEFRSDGLFRFSLMAPADANVCFPQVAVIGGTAAGDEECYPAGVYLTGSGYPYGLVLEYTTLPEQEARVSFQKEYAEAVASDIDFGVDSAVMLVGQDKAIGTSEAVSEVFYTKYLVRNGQNLYLASIQTDENLTNFDTLKKILQSLRFENGSTATGYQTYTSELLNFTINHPVEWFLKDDILSSYDLTRVTGKETFPQNPSLKCDFVSYDPSLYRIEYETVIKDQAPKISKIIGEYATSLPQPGPQDVAFYLFSDNEHAAVSLTCFSFAESFNSSFDQMIGTFQFLD